MLSLGVDAGINPMGHTGERTGIMRWFLGGLVIIILIIYYIHRINSFFYGHGRKSLKEAARVICRVFCFFFEKSSVGCRDGDLAQLFFMDRMMTRCARS